MAATGKPSDNTWGGDDNHMIFAVAAMADGLALEGYTGAPGAGAAGMWLVRTDAAGEPLWERSYGGSGQARALAVLPDGFALAGFTGGQDISLVRTDALGNKIWYRTWGGAGTDMRPQGSQPARVRVHAEKHSKIAVDLRIGTAYGSWR